MLFRNDKYRYKEVIFSMQKIAVIGGLGTLAGGDLFFKLLKNKQVLKNQSNFHFGFEQKPYTQMDLPLYQEKDIKSRKFYTYSICKNFEAKNFTKILIPCFASHSFINELQKEISIPIVNLYEALKNFVKKRLPKGSRIGILSSDYVKDLKITKEYFQDYTLIYPENQNLLMESIYSKQGIKNGYLEGIALENIYSSCLNLIENGCDLVIPLITEISLIADQIRKRGIQILDVNQIYADYALQNESLEPLKPFKLGILGGVGPAATVDFMNKVIQNTPAQKDQEHIKMIVEQNPQIPDRTAHLIHKDTDPTISMFSTCKRLEVEGANAIAIPCNTAHAFVDSIQPHLNIPIINMITETAKYILENWGENVNVGLLATTGTIQTNVYTNEFYKFKLNAIVPDYEHQEFVMESIYGAQGVKAGFTEGLCKENLLKAIDYLIKKDVEVIVLGCTELPLMFKNYKEYKYKQAIIIDPTEILAKKIVQLSKSEGNT